MDLRLLRYFAACVEHKNLHAAAEALHISQPALSKAVRNLEAEFGVPLLERRPRGVVPTAYGETLLRYAKLMDGEMRRATTEIDAMRGATKGKIHIGTLPTMIAPITKAARQVMISNPGLKLVIRAAFSAELMSALNEGELDVAVVLIPQTGSTPGLKFEPLRPIRPVIAARVGHPLATQATIALQDLTNFPWLLPSYPPAHRQIINRVFLDAGVQPPSAAMEVSAVVFFESLIRETDMLTVVPSTLLNSEQGVALVALNVDFPFPEEQIGLGYRDTSVVLPGARVVMQSIRNACAEQLSASV